MRKTFWPLAVALISAWTADARAEVIIHKKISYFAIGGLTTSDLDRELMTRGPMTASGGIRHPGATRKQFSGSAQYLHKTRFCEIGGVKITLDAEIILPRWTNRKKGDARTVLIWDTLAADIRRHEERHVEIAQQHARALEKALLRLPPEKSCDALKAKVAEVSQQELLAHEADQQRFDRIEAANFVNRMSRLLQYRAAKSDRQ